MGRELPFLARVPGRTHCTLGPARSSPWHAQRLHGRQNWFACSRGVDCVRGPGAQLGYVPAMQHMDCHMDGATFLPDDLVECRVAECACFRRRNRRLQCRVPRLSATACKAFETFQPFFDWHAPQMVLCPEAA